jgi:hypothetical protein
LLLAEAVTPFIEKSAREAGYAATMPLAVPPRVLYRCIGALLQMARRKGNGRERPANRFRPRSRNGEVGLRMREPGTSGKPRLQ